MTTYRTPLGYEVLGPGDPLSSDGYAFTGFNPVLADLLGRLGAFIHRHDAHAGMADPTDDLSIAVETTGGALAAGTPIYVTYTLNDDQGGETLPAPTQTVTTPAGFSDPVAAPTCVVDFSAGGLLANTYTYAASVSDGMGGETALGPSVDVQVPASTMAQNLISGLSAIVASSSGGASGAGWRLWRSLDGGVSWTLMGTGDASTDTFADQGNFGGDCSVLPLLVGTTGGTGELTVQLPASGDLPAQATFINLYACTDGNFLNPCLLGTYPPSDAGSTETFSALSLQAGAPPPVSTCFGGANQIDPNTELLNWPWKTPVATVGDLPTEGNDNGDTRIVLAGPALYTWDENTSTWTEPPGTAANVSDGSTTVASPNEIIFDGASVTDNDDGTATVTIASDSGGGDDSGGGGASLTVAGGATTVDAVTLITFAGATVSSTGSGDVTVTIDESGGAGDGDGTLFSDTFQDVDGTALEAHTSDSNGSWTKSGLEGSADLLISDDTLTPQTESTPTDYYCDAAPTTADYAVKATITGDASAGDGAGVWFRWDGATYTGYYAHVSQGEVRLYLADGGFATVLAGPFAFPAGGELQLSGAGASLTLSVNGAAVGTVTNGEYTTAGKAGLRLGTSDGGAVAITAFSVTAASGSALPVGEWQSADYATGWSTSDNPVQYMLDALGFVHIRGSATTDSTASLMFTLPAGFCPDISESYVAMGDGGAAAYVQITTDGEVSATISSGDDIFLGGGVTFTAATAPPPLFSDTFHDADDTELENHTSDSGGTWGKDGLEDATSLRIVDDMLQPQLAEGATDYLCVPEQSVDDYSVSMTISGTVVSGSNAGVWLRWDGETAGYYAGVSDGQATLYLADLTTVLAGPFDFPADGTLRLSAAGNVLTLDINGSTAGSATDGEYAGPGYAGLRLGPLVEGEPFGVTEFEVDN